MPESITLLSEDAIINSNVFKALIIQAKDLAEEAAKSEELKNQLNERTNQL